MSESPGGYEWSELNCVGDSVSLVRWSNAYRVGLRVIDNDHQELFEIINGIAAAVMQRHAPGVVAGRLERLMRHAREHFPVEENFMVQAQFPGLSEHQGD